MTMFLAGCQTAHFDRRACPREVVYTVAEQKVFREKLRETPEEIRRLVRDYLDLRDKVRACRS